MFAVIAFADAVIFPRARSNSSSVNSPRACIRRNSLSPKPVPPEGMSSSFIHLRSHEMVANPATTKMITTIDHPTTDAACAR